MKTIINPIQSLLYSSTLFKRKNKIKKEEYIKNSINALHQMTCEAITRYVIMGKTNSFECKKFIEFYKELCKFQKDFIKNNKISTIDFIHFRRNLMEYYNSKFKEEM